MILQIYPILLSITIGVHGASLCRTQPGDPSFPSKAVLNTFNRSIDNRLLAIVPSGEFCQQLAGGCPDDLWFNGNFRNNIPGAVLQVSVL